MKVTVTHEFMGQPDDENRPRLIRAGEEITGDLARVAIEQGWAKGPKKKPPKNKATQPPLDKSGAASRPARASRKRTSKKRKT